MKTHPEKPAHSSLHIMSNNLACIPTLNLVSFKGEKHSEIESQQQVLLCDSSVTCFRVLWFALVLCAEKPC